MYENERRQLNQLARETFLLKDEVDKMLLEFERRYNAIRKQVAELWEDIDQKLDKGETNER
jgi:hypothetical protein